ncbi:hypothetical protein QTV44_002473 [Vibrio vulnificus]|nr:hypothetical protein [Vibrio vulnificus]
MKSLNNYTDKALTNLLEQCGGFFAFSQTQFSSKAVEGEKYTNLGGGLIVRSDSVTRFTSEYPEIVKKGIEQDLKENGKDGVIRRELFNHECFYTGDIDDCVDALDGYGITREEIVHSYNTIRSTEDVDC